MNNIRVFAAAVFAAISLSACATTYGEMGMAGGVASASVTSDTYRISARGNGYTDPTTIQDYVLLKAAETTIASGHTHFTALDNRDASSNTRFNSGATVSQGLVGAILFGPSYSYDIVKPGEDLMIRVWTPKAGEALPPNTFPALDVYNNINPRVKRSPPKKPATAEPNG